MKPYVRNSKYLQSGFSLVNRVFPQIPTMKWCSPQRSIAEVKTATFWREVLAEGLATLTLVFFLVLLLISNDRNHYSPNTTHGGLFAGFLVCMLVEGFGPISGAHMNPAVSLGLFIVGHISAARFIIYVAIQFAGGLAGTGLGYLCTPSESRSDFHRLGPNPLMTPGQCVLLEAALTFNLVFIAMSCSDSKSRFVAVPGLPIGFAIGLGIMAAGTHSGGVQNPVAALGPAILSGDFQLYWVYFVGPCIGGALGALTYTMLLWIKNKYGSKSKPEVEEQDKAKDKKVAMQDEIIDILQSLLRDREGKV